ncbi:MAG: YraN family protein [Ilumatobacteraceae bacterium]
MGVGHVPQEPIRPQGEGAQLQGPQRRRTSQGGSLGRARGRWGEDLVATHYQRRGWRIVARNFRSKRGELDVVAFRDGVLAVVEVKARRSDGFGDPLESISPAKQLRVRRATSDLLESQGASLRGLRITRVRYDAASVLGSRVEVLEDAF